jgi:hypothetical protein
MDEKKVSSQVYSQTEEYFISKLHDFMRFYQEYRVIHGKTKHGFTIRTNVTIKPVSALSQPINFENSIIQALIRKPIRTQGYTNQSMTMGDLLNGPSCNYVTT